MEVEMQRPAAGGAEDGGHLCLYALLGFVENRASVDNAAEPTAGPGSASPPALTPDAVYRAYESKRAATLADIADPRECDATLSRLGFARDVLSDPLRRSVYNAFGEDGLVYIEHMFGVDVARSIGLHVTILTTGLGMLALMLCGLIFSGLLAARVDSGTAATLSASQVVAPLWAAGVVMAVIGAGFIAASVAREGPTAARHSHATLDPEGRAAAKAPPLPSEKRRVPTAGRAQRIAFALTFITYAIALVGIAIIATWDVTDVFVVPAIAASVAEAFFISAVAHLVSPSRVAVDFARLGFRRFTAVHIVGVVACRVVLIFSRATALTLFALKQLGVLTGSWFVVSWSGLAMYAGVATAAVLHARLRQRMGARGARVVQACAPPVTVAVLAGTSIAMLTAKLDGRASLPLWLCFIPAWLAYAPMAVGLAISVGRLAAIDVTESQREL